MHTVYDHKNFYSKFESDLRNSRFLVLIQSPFMTVRRVNDLRPLFEECVARGVRICIFAQKIDNRFISKVEYEQRCSDLEHASQRLLTVGVHVNTVPKIHEKLVIVDEKIFWEGSLNPLSYRDTSERMTRWECHHKVREAAFRHNLHKCSTCDCSSAIEDFQKDIGLYIWKRRKELNLTQKKLSEIAIVGQSDISRIEKGEYDCRLSRVSKLLAAMNLRCRLLAWYTIPAIDSKLDSTGIENHRIKKIEKTKE